MLYFERLRLISKQALSLRCRDAWSEACKVVQQVESLLSEHWYQWWLWLFLLILQQALSLLLMLALKCLDYRFLSEILEPQPKFLQVTLVFSSALYWNKVESWFNALLFDGAQAFKWLSVFSKLVMTAGFSSVQFSTDQCIWLCFGWFSSSSLQCDWKAITDCSRKGMGGQLEITVISHKKSEQACIRQLFIWCFSL